MPAHYTDRVHPTDCRHLLLFGGSFDPPHAAHLLLPMLAMEAIGADGVAYIPVAVSPHKTDQPPTAAHHRLAMLRLMLEGVSFATIITDEIDRHAIDGAPSYTIDTVTTLAARLPGVKLSLLIGTDQLRSFDRWRDHEKIAAIAEPVVMVRPPLTRKEMLASLPGGFDATTWVRRMIDLPAIDVSSTLIRQRIAAGKPVTGLVTPAVERYIADQRLYQA